MKFVVMLAAAVLSMAVAAPATAGTAQAPDVIDTCGKAVTTYDPTKEGLPEGAIPELDLCAGWLDAVHTDTDGERVLTSVQLGLKVQGDIADAPAGHSIHWGWRSRRTDCYYEVTVRDVSNAPTLMRDCGERGTRPLVDLILYRHPSVSLGESSVSVNGSEMTVTIDLADAPALVRESLAAGEVLTAMHVGTGFSTGYPATQDVGADGPWDDVWWDSDVQL